MRTPEERQQFIRDRIDVNTTQLNDAREQFLRYTEELMQNGDSLSMAHFLPRTAMDYADAYHKLLIAKAEAERDADDSSITN